MTGTLVRGHGVTIARTRNVMAMFSVESSSDYRRGIHADTFTGALDYAAEIVRMESGHEELVAWVADLVDAPGYAEEWDYAWEDSFTPVFYELDDEEG